MVRTQGEKMRCWRKTQYKLFCLYGVVLLLFGGVFLILSSVHPSEVLARLQLCPLCCHRGKADQSLSFPAFWRQHNVPGEQEL